MILALTLTGDVDPATAALALITLVSLVFGGLALRQTQREIGLSRRQVEDAHRPVVVPFVSIAKRFRLVAGQGLVAAEPQVRNGGLLIPVQNIGSGPALDVDVAVTLRDDAGGMSPDWGDEKHVGVFAGIGVSASVPVNVEVPTLAGDMPTFDIRVTCADVANKKWVTYARYLSQQKRYVDISIGGLSEGACGLRHGWPRVDGLFGIR